MNALSAILVLLALSIPAQAQVPGRQPASPTAASPLDATFSAWDADHNRLLSRDEFEKGWQSLRERITEARRLRDQFDKLDANHDGGIDATEYGTLVVVRRLGKSAPPLSALDANRDQRLQFDEYLALLRQVAMATRAAKAATP